MCKKYYKYEIAIYKEGNYGDLLFKCPGRAEQRLRR